MTITLPHLSGIEAGVVSDNSSLSGGGSNATRYGCPGEEIDGRKEQAWKGWPGLDDGRHGSEDGSEVLERGDDAVGDGGE